VRRPADSRRRLAASLVLVGASLLATASRADEVPVPGPAVEGQATKVAPGTPGSEPLWELGMGGAWVRFDDYRGSDRTNNYLLPLPFVAYRGRFLRADRDGARAILFAGKRVLVDLSLAASVPTKSKNNEARRGMPDLAATFEIGPNLNVELWQSADRRLKLDLRLPVREAITIERSPRAIGVTFSPNLNLDVRGFAGAWNLGVLAGPLYADRRYHEHFYGGLSSLQSKAQLLLQKGFVICQDIVAGRMLPLSSCQAVVYNYHVIPSFESSHVEHRYLLKRIPAGKHR